MFCLKYLESLVVKSDLEVPNQNVSGLQRIKKAGRSYSHHTFWLKCRESKVLVFKCRLHSTSLAGWSGYCRTWLGAELDLNGSRAQVCPVPPNLSPIQALSNKVFCSLAYNVFVVIFVGWRSPLVCWRTLNPSQPPENKLLDDQLTTILEQFSVLLKLCTFLYMPIALIMFVPFLTNHCTCRQVLGYQKINLVLAVFMYLQISVCEHHLSKQCVLFTNVLLCLLEVIHALAPMF